MTFVIHYNAWPLQALSNYWSALIYYLRWQGDMVWRYGTCYYEGASKSHTRVWRHLISPSPPHLKERKLRLAKVKQCIQGHTAHKSWIQDMNVKVSALMGFRCPPPPPPCPSGGVPLMLQVSCLSLNVFMFIFLSQMRKREHRETAWTLHFQVEHSHILH